MGCTGAGQRGPIEICVWMGCTGAVPKITRIFVKGNVGLFLNINLFAKEMFCPQGQEHLNKLKLSCVNLSLS